VSQARRQDIAAGGANNQEGPKTRRGGHILKILYEMYAATRGSNVNGGHRFQMGRAGHHWPCGAFPLTSFFLFCVEKHHGLKVTFHHNVKENLFHFLTNISAFLPVYWLTRDRYRCLQ